MNRKDRYTILKLITDNLYVFGFLLLIPALIGLGVGEHALAGVFAVGASVFVPGGWALRRHLVVSEVRYRHAAMAIALTWLSLSLISCIPFVLYGIDGLDALFESFSAWTDTGLTMIPHPEDLPVSLSVFRVLMQWVSGLGIVMFMLSLRGPSPRAAHSLFQAEGRFEDFSTDLWTMGRTVVAIYSGYTVLGFVLLWLLGVPPFHALTHAITSLSTGGFSTNNVGVGLYGALPSLVAMVLMLCGGISFGSHQALLSGDVKKFFRNPEIRALFAIVTGATGLLLLEQWLTRGQVRDRILDSLFYVVTAISTCGAGTTLSLTEVPDTFVFTILFLMLIGAVYGSTTGALKLWRLLILGKVVQREIKRPFYPQGTVMPLRMGHNLITEEVALQVAAYVLLYMALGLMGSLSFMLFGYDALHAMFTVFSAQGNVGLNAMPDVLYYGMPAFLKVQLIFHMLIGRMEILPFFYVLRSLRE
jgi:trk system potassium uptake protein TrkH